MNMNERDKVIEWLTEIRLRPCDFSRDDFDDYETEHLAINALELLKDQEPVPPEMEGGGYNWYPVCGACHGVIGDMDSYCRHCGTPVLKEKAKPHHNKGGEEE